MTFRRRAVLSAGTSLLAGCAGIGGSSPTPEPTPTDRPDSDHDGLPDVDDGYPEDYKRGRRLRSVDARITLTPGDYEPYFLSPGKYEGFIDYELVARGDTGIDIFMFKPKEYEKYTEHENPKTLTTYTWIDTTTALRAFFTGHGERVFVLDYTARVTPPGPESVDVKLKLDFAQVSPAWEGINTPK